MTGERPHISRIPVDLVLTGLAVLARSLIGLSDIHPILFRRSGWKRSCKRAPYAEHGIRRHMWSAGLCGAAG
jgi:hypothetical protein